jgi:hypothetical protein
MMELCHFRVAAAWGDVGGGTASFRELAESHKKLLSQVLSKSPSWAELGGRLTNRTGIQD